MLWLRYGFRAIPVPLVPTVVVYDARVLFGMRCDWHAAGIRMTYQRLTHQRRGAVPLVPPDSAPR
jgi:hypothetical protein